MNKFLKNKLMNKNHCLNNRKPDNNIPQCNLKSKSTPKDNQSRSETSTTMTAFRTISTGRLLNQKETWALCLATKVQSLMSINKKIKSLSKKLNLQISRKKYK
jgi:hypothetical protein